MGRRSLCRSISDLEMRFSRNLSWRLSLYSCRFQRRSFEPPHAGLDCERTTFTWRTDLLCRTLVRQGSRWRERTRIVRGALQDTLRNGHLDGVIWHLVRNSTQRSEFYHLALINFGISAQIFAASTE